MPMPGRTFDSENYRYGFGGHEKDDEVKGTNNQLNFGDYGYDPRLGRRFTIDVNSSEMPGTSPYSYGYNNPIVLKDPDGKLPILPFLLKAGVGGATDMMLQIRTVSLLAALAVHKGEITAKSIDKNNSSNFLIFLK